MEMIIENDLKSECQFVITHKFSHKYFRECREADKTRSNDTLVVHNPRCGSQSNYAFEKVKETEKSPSDFVWIHKGFGWLFICERDKTIVVRDDSYADHERKLGILEAIQKAFPEYRASLR